MARRRILSNRLPGSDVAGNHWKCRLEEFNSFHFQKEVFKRSRSYFILRFHWSCGELCSKQDILHHWLMVLWIQEHSRGGYFLLPW